MLSSIIPILLGTVIPHLLPIGIILFLIGLIKFSFSKNKPKPLSQEKSELNIYNHQTNRKVVRFFAQIALFSTLVLLLSIAFKLLAVLSLFLLSTSILFSLLTLISASIEYKENKSDKKLKSYLRLGIFLCSTYLVIATLIVVALANWSNG